MICLRPPSLGGTVPCVGPASSRPMGPPPNLALQRTPATGAIAGADVTGMAGSAELGR